MDPLSDILSLLKVRSYMVGGFDMGGDFSVEFHPHEGIKCYAVVSGGCWLAVEGVDEPVRLKQGDCFLLVRGRPFKLATDLSLPSEAALPLLQSAERKGGVAVIRGGGSCFLLGGFFAFSGGHAGELLSVLPPIVHLEGERERSTMGWALERMRVELLEQQPGASLVAQHLAQMMLVQALRLHMAEVVGGGAKGVGWLFALADPRLSAALAAIHTSPGQRWTLQDLAEKACMSRTIFAERFKATVGTSPMEYLTRWRMLIAGDRLTNSRESLAEIASALAYESESAFSTAFKRVMGCSPRQYGRAEKVLI